MDITPMEPTMDPGIATTFRAAAAHHVAAGSPHAPMKATTGFLSAILDRL